MNHVYLQADLLASSKLHGVQGFLSWAEVL